MLNLRWEKLFLGQGNIPGTSLQNVAAMTELSVILLHHSINIRVHDKLS